MGIDGIGKKPSLPVGSPTTRGAEGIGGAGPTQKTGATFEVGGPEATKGTSAASTVDATAPLARLKAGEIDVNQYVDLKVDEATKHLGAMPPSDLADIKSMLREKLVSDPNLVGLVHQATGATPSAPEE